MSSAGLPGRHGRARAARQPVLRRPLRRAALPLLRQGRAPAPGGGGQFGDLPALPRAEAYGASKAGLRYLLDSLRIDLAYEGIDVTLVSPGFVDTR